MIHIQVAWRVPGTLFGGRDSFRFSQRESWVGVESEALYCQITHSSMNEPTKWFFSGIESDSSVPLKW